MTNFEADLIEKWMEKNPIRGWTSAKKLVEAFNRAHPNFQVTANKFGRVLGDLGYYKKLKDGCQHYSI